MSSLSRMLSVLDLFTETTPAWTAEAVASHLACSLPTGYRYVRALAAAGLLRRGGGGTYVLGPRASELDYQMRITDPVLRAGEGAFRSLCDATGCDVVVAGVYGDRIITTHQLHGSEGVSATYGRGRRMPLFRGMLSKILLASLPRARLRRLYDANAAEAKREKFASTWEVLLENLKAVRSAGYCVTLGELDPALVGIGVPLASREHEVLAALGLIVSKRRFATSDVERLVGMLHDAAEDTVTALERRAADVGDRLNPP